MKPVTLKKMHFKFQGKCILDADGKWVSDGRWAVLRGRLKNDAVFRNAETVRAALGLEPYIIHDNDPWKTFVPDEGIESLLEWAPTIWLVDREGVTAARVYVQCHEGAPTGSRILLLAEDIRRLWFQDERVYTGNTEMSPVICADAARIAMPIQYDRIVQDDSAEVLIRATLRTRIERNRAFGVEPRDWERQQVKALFTDPAEIEELLTNPAEI